MLEKIDMAKVMRKHLKLNMNEAGHSAQLITLLSLLPLLHKAFAHTYSALH